MNELLMVNPCLHGGVAHLDLPLFDIPFENLVLVNSLCWPTGRHGHGAESETCPQGDYGMGTAASSIATAGRSGPRRACCQHGPEGMAAEPQDARAAPGGYRMVLERRRRVDQPSASLSIGAQAHAGGRHESDGELTACRSIGRRGPEAERLRR